MLQVISLEDADRLLAERFSGMLPLERVPIGMCPGRVAGTEICAREDVPAFTRSTVDGFAVIARDTFGCSESIPAMFALAGEVRMGEPAAFRLKPGECAAVPTGGALPEAADAVVMLEYAELPGDGTVLLEQPAAPGRNVIYAGDDVRRGACVISAGTRLTARSVGVLAMAGCTEVLVRRSPVVGILSTGDELVPPEETPGPGQMRDVNGPMLESLMREQGAETHFYGIVPDNEALLRETLMQAVAECDLVLLSGGSSVGARDASAQVLGACGEVLFHGLSVKPGKPTLAADLGGTPVLGLPGHPAAAYFIARLLALPMLCRMEGVPASARWTAAVLSAAIPSNHGREEYVLVSLHGGVAEPVPNKSGLIASLARVDGYVRVPRDCEGFSAGETVNVYEW